MSAPAPGTPEWQKIVTASKVAAIIGVSPWESPYSIWQRMKGNLPPVETNDAMRRGNYLEAGVIAWWKAQHPEYPLVEEQFYAHSAGFMPWAAATLDARAGTDYDVEPPEDVILEVKTQSRMDDWGQPGTDEIPTHYLTQVYWQLAMCPEAKRAYVAVLGPFLEFSEYVVERDDAIQADLIARCQAFYESLAGDVPPALDDSVATFDTLKALNPSIDKGESIDVGADLGIEYVASVTGAKQAIARERAAKSAVLDGIGLAQYATANGVRVARRQANKYGVSLISTATLTDLESAA